MLSPFFSLSLSPLPSVPLAHPFSLSLSALPLPPFLPVVSSYLPPFLSSTLSITASISVSSFSSVPKIMHKFKKKQKKKSTHTHAEKHTKVQTLLLYRNSGWQESVKDKTGGVKRERAWSVCLRVCEREQEWGGANAGKNSSFVSWKTTRRERERKKELLCNYNSKRGKTCFLLMSGQQF